MKYWFYSEGNILGLMVWCSTPMYWGMAYKMCAVWFACARVRIGSFI